MRKGFGDGVMGMLQLRPYRCNSCSNRFFRFDSPIARLVVPILVLIGLTALVVAGLYGRDWARSVRHMVLNPKAVSAR